MKRARLGLAALAVLVAAAPAHALAAKDGKLRATISADQVRRPAHQGEDLAGTRLRLRLRVRRGQPLHDRRLLRDRERRALALLRPRRDLEVLRQRRRQQQPRLRLLLRADQRVGDRRGPDLAAAARGPARRSCESSSRGYVAGYNAYLRDTGVDHIPDPRCRGADWVRPITELDVYRRFHQLGSLASSGAAIDGIGGRRAVAPRRRARGGRARPGRRGGRARQRRGRGLLPARQRLERLRARQRGDRQRQRDGARQPALPLGRRRAPLPGPAHDPGQARRLRRLALRRAGGADRPQPRARLVAHRRLGLALHPVRAHPRPRRPALLPGRRPAEADEGGRADGPGEDRRRHARGPQRGRSTRPSTGRW